MPRLTKRTVEAAPTRAREYVLWEESLPGFGLRVWPSGRRAYIVQYRVGGGRSARIRKATLGRYGVLSPDQARIQAREWLALAAQGRDPAAERTAKVNAPSVAELCDRYLNDHARKHKKPRSVKEDERNIANHVLPLLGHRKTAEVATSDIDRVLATVKAGRRPKTGNQAPLRGGPFIANRVRALLSKMFSLAERWEIRPDSSNPVRYAVKYRENKRERFLTSDELRRLGDALHSVGEAGEASHEALACIRFLVLTGCRVSEALSLRWEDIDFEHALAHLIDSKTGAKPIRLPSPAIDILMQLAECRSDNPFVFAGQRKNLPLTDLKRPWARVCAEAGLSGARLHDLRHTMASVGVSSHFSLLVIGKLLGHTQAATTQRYAHLADDPLREASETIAESIQRDMTQGR